MTTRWTLTFDCADVLAMARFWTIALGYVEQSPPEGWDTWEEWLRHFDVPEEELGDGASLKDPAGILPSVSFLKVPEPKSAKNRLHLDLQVSGGRHLGADKHTARIEEKAAELVDAGASIDFRSMQVGALDHIVLLDPEGNEFCVV